MNVRTGPKTQVRTRTVTPAHAMVSFTRAQWLTLTMLADLLEFQREQTSATADDEPTPNDLLAAAITRRGDGWLDARISDLASECRKRGLDEQVARLARQYPGQAHLLASAHAHA